MARSRPLRGSPGCSADVDGGLEVGGGEGALVVANDGDGAVLAGFERRYVGDIHARSVALAGAVSLIGRLHVEALASSRVRAADLAALRVLEVDGDVRVVDLGARDVEEAEGEARLPGNEDGPGGRGDDLVRLPHVGDELVDRPVSGLGKVGGGRRFGGRLARGGGLVVSAASGGGEGECR